MDILKLISRKISLLSSINCNCDGFKSVAYHIECAENHYINGIKESRNPLFTDSVYRLNQAFEGSLREAHILLDEGNQIKKVSVFEIEKYLISNDVFKERVTDLISNYRKNWRNISTHDHMQIFSHEEAILGIVNVSAFCSILLDKIISDHKHSAELLSTNNAIDTDFKTKVDEVSSLEDSSSGNALNDFFISSILEREEIRMLFIKTKQVAIFKLLADEYVGTAKIDELCSSICDAGLECNDQMIEKIIIHPFIEYDFSSKLVSFRYQFLSEYYSRK